jgi:hypothetical protein
VLGRAAGGILPDCALDLALDLREERFGLLAILERRSASANTAASA